MAKVAGVQGLTINNTIMEGTVKFYHPTRGYGFITPFDKGDDLPVDAEGLREVVKENDKVRFEVQNDKDGLRAVNVKLA